jgi:hypothetical protein
MRLGEAKLGFLESTDDSETKRHFNNSALQICYVDAEKGEVSEDVGELLNKVAREW